MVPCCDGARGLATNQEPCILAIVLVQLVRVSVVVRGVVKRWEGAVRVRERRRG